MAKTSSVAREVRRQQIVAKNAALRKELKEKGDYEGLRKLPRDSNPVRLHNRCKISGRSRAYLRKFGMSRLAFREMALEGKIPGVIKASW
jgi:small subunit ribosomal protein S14